MSSSKREPHGEHEAETTSAATSTRLLAVCGNHNPAHSATSLEEMQEKTKQYDCTNWRVVN
jgi:hypothetical protein